MEAAARGLFQGLGGEIGVQPVALGNELHDGLEGHHIVRRSEGVGVAEVNFILARALLVVGALRKDAHLGQGEADLPADVLSLVIGGGVHIAGPVVGKAGGIAVFIPLEQVELLLRTEEEGVPLLPGPGRCIPQQGPGVALKGPPVGIDDGAEHAHHLAVLRPPGQEHQSLRVGAQQQVGAGLVPEARDGRGVESDAVFKGSGQLRGHDGDIFLPPEHIAEGQMDKGHFLLQDVLEDLFFGILHGCSRSSLFKFPDIIAQGGDFFYRLPINLRKSKK